MKKVSTTDRKNKRPVAPAPAAPGPRLLRRTQRAAAAPPERPGARRSAALYGIQPVAVDKTIVYEYPVQLEDVPERINKAIFTRISKDISVSSGSLVAGMVNTDDVESSAVSRVGSRRPKWRNCTSRVGSIGTTISPPARSSESGRTKSCSVPSIAPGPGSWPRLLPTRCRMTASRSMTRQGAEDFLYREARLLDSGQFETWLGLFAANGLYWIPINEPAEGNLYSAVVSSNGVYCLIGFHSRHACAAPYTRGQENILAQEEQRDEYDSASRCGLCPDGHTSP